MLCYQYDGESESGLATMGSPENWCCIVLGRLRSVELTEDSWEIVPNHSGPATCVIQADIDAEDQPGRRPQQGIEKVCRAGDAPELF